MKLWKQILLIFIFLSGVVFTSAQKNNYNTDQQIIKEFDRLNGKFFPSMELEDATGNTIRTDSLKGKTIYMEFWFTACPPCIQQIPYSKLLHQYFEKDSNIVFINICIENIDRKSTWQKMVKEKKMAGIQLFYARNRPQKTNLIREFLVDDFPTCLLINDKQQVIGYKAPAPSQTGWVHWAITQAAAAVPLSAAYQKMIQQSTDYKIFMAENKDQFSAISSLQ